MGKGVALRGRGRVENFLKRNTPSHLLGVFVASNPLGRAYEATVSRKFLTYLRALSQGGILLHVVAMTASARTTQDTVVLHANGSPVWGDSVSVVEEIRIGVLDGGDEYTLGHVAAMTVDGEGSIYVYDAQVPIIREYDAAGRFIRNVGREGAGPGEYRDVLGMAMLPGLELAVWDVGNSRITVYDSTATYITSHRVPSALHSWSAFLVDTAGHYYVKAADLRRVSTGHEGTTASMPELFIRLSRTGAVQDSVFVPSRNGNPGFVLSTPEGPRGTFTKETVYALSPFGYLVTGVTSRYAINLLMPTGRIRRIERHIEPVTVLPAEREMWRQWARFLAARGSGEPRSYPDLPRQKPAFRALSVDEDGRVWVDRYVRALRDDSPQARAPVDERPTYEWREPPTFDVITPIGTFLGTVVMPRNALAYVRRGMHVWGVQSGESREPYVVRWRIVPSQRPG